MKTTLDLDDGLVSEAKRRALEQGRPLSRLLEDALQAYLDRLDRTEGEFRLRIRVAGITPMPGLDFSDRDALHERMEARS